MSNPAKSFWKAGIAAIILGMVVTVSGYRAVAQQSPLIGVWSASFNDQSGKAWLTAYLQFAPNGAVLLKGFYVGGTQPLIETGTYQVSPDGGTLQMTFTDYQPKQCIPMAGQNYCEPPPVNVGQPTVKGISFEGSDHLRFSDGALYTRAPAVP